MFGTNYEEVAIVKRNFKPGDRVVLQYMDDYNSVPVGTEGTVTNVDDIGTIHVKWDKGRTLGVVLGVDCCYKK